jgi:molecular chaperone DnaJ
MIKIAGMGEAIKGGVTGDMFVKVRVAKDLVWAREGMDLVSTHKIKLTDALLGFKHVIPGLDGDIEVSLSGGVSINEVVRVTGRGVPYGNKRSRGDALIRIQVELPKKLSRESKKLIESLKEEGL